MRYSSRSDLTDFMLSIDWNDRKKRVVRWLKFVSINFKTAGSANCVGQRLPAIKSWLPHSLEYCFTTINWTRSWKEKVKHKTRSESHLEQHIDFGTEKKDVKAAQDIVRCLLWNSNDVKTANSVSAKTTWIYLSHKPKYHWVSHFRRRSSSSPMVVGPSCLSMLGVTVSLVTPLMVLI